MGPAVPGATAWSSAVPDPSRTRRDRDLPACLCRQRHSDGSRGHLGQRPSVEHQNRRSFPRLDRRSRTGATSTRIGRCSWSARRGERSGVRRTMRTARGLRPWIATWLRTAKPRDGETAMSAHACRSRLTKGRALVSSEWQRFSFPCRTTTSMSPRSRSRGVCSHDGATSCDSPQNTAAPPPRPISGCSTASSSVSSERRRNRRRSIERCRPMTSSGCPSPGQTSNPTSSTA